MKKQLIWMASILLAAILYLFENNPGTLTLLVGAFVVPAFGLLPLIGKGIGLELAFHAAPEKGQSGNGILTVTNRSWLPKPRLRMMVTCRNLRTAEAAEIPLELSLLPRQRKQIGFTFACSHCGKAEIAVTGAKSADVFGLFTRQLPCKAETTFTVVPRLFEPAVSLESCGMSMPDSDTYSPTKPGSDPGETFAIREYVPGDAIHRIHWKLSEKTDKTMVRDFGLPVVEEAALLLETAGAQSPEETDAITEVFASLSSALLEGGVRHHVFWRDSRTDELLDDPITDGDDFGLMLEQLLQLPPREDGSVARRFLERYPHCPYAHVMIVGGRIPAGVGNLCGGSRVSVLIPRRNTIPEGLQPDGTHVLSFSVDGYAMDLCRLEV